MNKKILPLLIGALVVSMPLSVGAEETWDGIRVTCLHDLGYFAVETITTNLGYSAQNGLDANGSQIASKLESENGIFTAQSLLKKPYVCALENNKISVEIKDFDAAHERGECATVDHFSLLVRVDGKEVHEFPAYGINRCTNAEKHLVELVDFGNFKKLEDCTMIENGQSSCKKETLE